MKRRVSLALSLLAVLWPAWPGYAQDLEETASREETLRITSRFASCMVARRRSRVVAVLEAIPASRVEWERVIHLTRDAGDCLVGSSRNGLDVTRLVFHPVVLRGPLAEALFERDFAGLGQPRAQQLANFPDLVEIRRRPDLNEAELGSAVLGGFAYCVVEAAPVQAVALLRTAPASTRERAAVQQISPYFGSCFPAGRTLTINRPLLRGFVAEALYRHAAARASRPAEEAPRL